MRFGLQRTIRSPRRSDALLSQHPEIDATDSVTMGAFTTDPTVAQLFRLRIEPDE